MNPAIAAVAREHAQLPTDQIIGEIRDRIGVWRPLPSVTYRESAIDYLVHPQDIAIPLGRELAMPSDAAVVAVDRVWSSDRMFHARKRYPGYRFVATDADWSVGEGAEVARTGRRAAAAAHRSPSGTDEPDRPGCRRPPHPTSHRDQPVARTNPTATPRRPRCWRFAPPTCSTVSGSGRARPRCSPDGPTVLGIEQGHPDLPAGTDVLDPGDTTVLPGLIDSHSHLVGDSRDGALDRVAGYTGDELAAVVAESLRTQLASGVTVVRDLGDRDWVAVAHRDRQHACSGATGSDPADEPTVLASGPPITSPGGHCHALGGEVSGHDDIARAVRERADRRVDVIKVMASGGMTTAGTDVLGTQFSDDDLTFLVHEAHRHGLPVTAHAHSLPAVEQALAAGVDGLEHASCLTADGFAVPDAVLDLLAERQIPVGAALGSPPVAAFAHAPAAVRAQFERIGLTPEAFREARLATIRRMHEAGVLFLAGRDSGISSFLTHGSHLGLDRVLHRGRRTHHGGARGRHLRRGRRLRGW